MVLCLNAYRWTLAKKTSNIQNTHPIGHSELPSESHLVDMMKLKKLQKNKRSTL